MYWLLFSFNAFNVYLLRILSTGSRSVYGHRTERTMSIEQAENILTLMNVHFLHQIFYTGFQVPSKLSKIRYGLEGCHGF